jgi:hypothetical protein
MDSWLNNLLNKLGIPPLYFGTLIMLIVSIVEAKNLRIWDKLPRYMKRYIITAWITAFIGLLASIIAFFSIHF